MKEGVYVLVFEFGLEMFRLSDLVYKYCNLDVFLNIIVCGVLVIGFVSVYLGC